MMSERAVERTRRRATACAAMLPSWLAVPRGATAVRLTLLGLAIVLQDLIELPRGLLRDHLGGQLTGLLIFVATGGSLALLLLALQARLPAWRWLRSRWMQLGVLVLLLAAVPSGVRQVGVMLASGFQAPTYPNDGTTLDHYAAQQLLEGHNPYVTVQIIAAVQLYHQDPKDTTPLGQGAFAHLYPHSYPTKDQLRQVFAAESAGQPDQSPEFESHVSYPALAFLPLVPLVWAGLPSVVPFFVLCFLALVVLLLVSVPPTVRPWIGLLALADAPLINGTVAGDLDVFYIVLLFVAWRWWRRPLLSTAFLGLAIAAKQLAWFFLPYYLLLVAWEYGWREAGKRLAGALALFVVINLPFFLNNPQAYLTGVLAPQVDRMFPAGTGLVQLSTTGLLPLAPQGVYAGLEALALLGCLGWYWRYGRAMPEAGFVLAMLPLFFAWRSLTTYFDFIALPAVALLLARLRETRSPLAVAQAQTSGSTWRAEGGAGRAERASARAVRSVAPVAALRAGRPSRRRRR